MHVRWRRVQQSHRILQTAPLRLQNMRGQNLWQRHRCQRTLNQFAPRRLRQPLHRRINRRERLRHRRMLGHLLHARMNHLRAKKAMPRLAFDPQQLTRLKRSQLRAVKIHITQHQNLARCVLRGHHQLTARTEFHLMFDHRHLRLRKLTQTQTRHRRDARLILIAQRHVQ